jgi:hypothetical protein
MEERYQLQALQVSCTGFASHLVIIIGCTDARQCSAGGDCGPWRPSFGKDFLL